MNIDFNNVRKQSLNAYNGVCQELHDLIEEGKLSSEHTHYLERKMKELRSTLVGIACTYREDDPEFECVIDEVEGGHLLYFNPEKETD